MTTTLATHDADEFVTIIGTDMDAIAREFRAQGLSEKRYSIVHRAGRHRFTRADGTSGEPLFDGVPLIAATYRRCTGR